MNPTDGLSVIRIPFHRTALIVVDIEDEPLLLLRPLVETLGLDYETQRREIAARPEVHLNQVVIAGSVCEHRWRTAVSVDDAQKVLESITVESVQPGALALLDAYRNELTYAVSSCWLFAKGAVGPRTDTAASSTSNLALTRLEALQASRGLVDARWLEEQARNVLSGILGELVPDPPLPTRHHLDAPTGSLGEDL